MAWVAPVAAPFAAPVARCPSTGAVSRLCRTRRVFPPLAAAPRELLASAAEEFRRQAIPEPDASASYLLASALGLSRPELRRLPHDFALSSDQLRVFRERCERRCRLREPIQYLVGDWSFYNVDLVVRPPVLIPRPETEELVDRIVQSFRGQTPPRRVLDIGCGTGAIGLALAREWGDKTHVTMIDPSDQAVNLATDNAKLLDLQVQVTLDSIQTYRQLGPLFDLIVSNPPYIPSPDMLLLAPEVKHHEDHRALDGGSDGLDVIREIVSRAPDLAAPKAQCWLEVDTSHPAQVRAIASRSPMITWGGSHDDFSGNPRFCWFEIAAGESGS